MKHRLSKLWKQLRKEKWLLLVCFVLAFLAWQAIRHNIGFVLPISNIAVDVDVPNGWALLDKSANTVDVRFRGSPEDIRDLNRDQLRIVIPVSHPEHGKDVAYKLESKFIKGNPTGAKAFSFNPPEIEIQLDQEGEKQLPVKATLNGSLPDGLEVERIVCTPATVRIKGARQQLLKMDNIRTEPIDLNDRNSSFKENVRIALPQTGHIQADPDRVTVEFILDTHSASQVYEKVPVRLLCVPGERRKIDVQPQSITVTVRGQQQRLDQLRSADLFAYVSCTGLTENTGYDLPVIVDLPSGLQLVKTEPAVVHVQIGNTNQELP